MWSPVEEDEEDLKCDENNSERDEDEIWNGIVIN